MRVHRRGAEGSWEKDWGWRGWWLVGIALIGAIGFSARGAGGRPNVLVIAIDDLNDWEGCLGGHPMVKTPRMDELAASGTLFTNAHCQAPLCNPSRTSILTGLRPSTTGVYALNPWFRVSEKYKNWVSLPQYFSANGYRTLTCGKVYHDAYPPPAEHTKEFNMWGFHGGANPKPAKKFVQTPANIALMDWGVFPQKDEEQDDWKVADWAIGQLKEMPKDKPFVLFAGFRHPHVPCYATKKWWDLYPDDDSVLPPVKEDDRDDVPKFAWYLHWKLPEPRLAWLKAAGQWRPLVRAYLASTSFVDSQVGRVVDALKESGLGENTIVVLFSDHGWHLGEKGITGKNTLWERSTHVPFIFAGPGVKGGQRCGRPAELLDIYPTLVEMCGLPKKEGLEGHSLVGQLRDAGAAREWPAITTHGPNNHTVRDERWRYIRYADGSEELYDMKADPNEWTNLAGEVKYASVKGELGKWMPKVNAAPVKGSKVRLVELKDGVVWWEGERVDPKDPVP